MMRHTHAAVATFTLIGGQPPLEILAENPMRVGLIFQIQPAVNDDIVALRFANGAGQYFPLRGRQWLGGGVGVDAMQVYQFAGDACPQTSVTLEALPVTPGAAITVNVIEVVE